MATDVTDAESALECISEHLALSLERRDKTPDLTIPPESKLQQTLVNFAVLYIPILSFLNLKSNCHSFKIHIASYLTSYTQALQD